MERTLVLTRKARQTVVLFVAGERIEVTCRRKDELEIKASDFVKIVRSELLEREQEREAAA